MELTGKIIAVLEARKGVSPRTGNNWMIQEYVLEMTDTFVRKCVFSVFGEDRIKQFNIHEGETLTIHFDIDAREFNGRWYNDVRAYNVVRENVQPPIVPNDVPKQVQPEPAFPQDGIFLNDDEEIPF